MIHDDIINCGKPVKNPLKTELTHFEKHDNLFPGEWRNGPPMSETNRLFDGWPEKYDRWFVTPIGSLVKEYESGLISDLLRPDRGELILDAGCGTGVFTLDILSSGPQIIGLDISLPMLHRAWEKARDYPFQPVLGDINTLPFPDESFDKVVSITALEFIQDARKAVAELFRVTKNGGAIVVATLNSLSPWAARRTEEAKKGHPIFSKTIFRSPEQLRSLCPAKGTVKTAIHFDKGDSPEKAIAIELRSRTKACDTGAFVAIRWVKP